MNHPLRRSLILVVRGSIAMRYNIGFCFVVVLILSGCNQSRIDDLEAQVADLQSELSSAESRNSELQSQLEEAQSGISQVESDLGTIQSASSDLTDAVSRFDYENWQDVVPDVTSAASEVESGTSALESSISSTKSALE